MTTRRALVLVAGTVKEIAAADVLGAGSLSLTGVANASDYLINALAGTLGWTGAGGVGIELYGAAHATPNLIAFRTANAERMRIEASGNVGIGVTTLLANLHVEKTASANILLKSTSTAAGDFSDLNITANDAAGRFTAYGTQHSTRPGQVWVSAYTASTLVLSTNNLERMRIDASGNVGIGGTSSGAVLETFKASAAVTPVSDNTFPAMTSGALLKNLSATDGAYVALSLVAANAAGTSQGFSLLSQSTAAGYSPSLLFLARTASGANTERMRLDTNGLVAIGTATTTKLLTLGKNDATQGPFLVFRNKINAAGGHPAGFLVDAYRDVSDPSYIAGVWGETSGTVGNIGQLVFATMSNGGTGLPTERMRIDASGNVGIGQAPNVAANARILDILGGSAGALLWLHNATGGGGVAGMQVQSAPTAAYVWNVENTPLLLGTNNAERMRIDASGNVLVGATTSIWATAGRGVLEINGSGGALLGFQIGGNGKGYLYHAGTDMQLINLAAGLLQFGTSAAVRLTIDASGNVGIGGTPAGGGQRLNVFANSQTTAVPMSINDARAADGVNSSSVYFYRNAALVGSISTTNAATFYNTTSDARLKIHIADASDAGDIIDAIRVRAFDWKASPDEHVTHGFIAQELVEVVPQAVQVGDDDVDSQPWGVDHSKLVPLLVCELQSLRGRVRSLETTLH